MRSLGTLLILLPLMGFAQHSLEWSYGYSLKTSLIKAGLTFTGQADFAGTPVTVASYEYRFHPLFGLGAGYTQQKLEGNYKYSIDGQEDRIDFNYERRSYILEPKFYYPLGMEQWEIYTGLRLGYKKEKLNATSTLKNTNEVLKLTDLVLGRGLNASISALGLNYYPSKYLGITTAVNVIGPYLIKGGLVVRF